MTLLLQLSTVRIYHSPADGRVEIHRYPFHEHDEPIVIAAADVSLWADALDAAALENQSAALGGKAAPF